MDFNTDIEEDPTARRTTLTTPSPRGRGGRGRLGSTRARARPAKFCTPHELTAPGEKRVPRPFRGGGDRGREIDCVLVTGGPNPPPSAATYEIISLVIPPRARAGRGMEVGGERGSKTICARSDTFPRAVVFFFLSRREREGGEMGARGKRPPPPPPPEDTTRLKL